MISRHRRFKQRILIERQVLQLVNSYFNTDNQLYGLTDATISRWEKEVLKGSSKDIVALIRKIALISHSNNDVSREVFAIEELKVFNDTNLDENINQLKIKLLELSDLL